VEEVKNVATKAEHDEAQDDEEAKEAQDEEDKTRLILSKYSNQNNSS